MQNTSMTSGYMQCFATVPPGQEIWRIDIFAYNVWQFDEKN